MTHLKSLGNVLTSLIASHGLLVSETQTLTGAIALLNSQGIMGLITSIPKLIIGLIAMGTEFGVAGLKAIGFEAILNTLNINPIILAISAIVAAGVGLYFLFDNLITTTEEYSEKLDESSQAYSETTSKIESLNSELETTQDRIKELEAQDTLTIVEENELEKLQQANAELERQIELNKLRKESEAATLSADFVTAVNTYADDKGIEWYDYILQWFVPSNKPFLDSNSEAFDNNLELYKEYQQKHQDAENDGNLEEAERYERLMESVSAAMSNYVKTEQGFIDDLGDLSYDSLSDSAKEVYDAIMEDNDRYMVTVEDDFEEIQTLLNSIFTRSKFSEANKALSEFADTGELTAEKIIELYRSNDNVREMIDYFAELGLFTVDINNFTESFEGLAKQLNAVEEEAQDAVSDFAELADIIEEIDNIQEIYNNISSVFSDYNENGFLSIDNLQTLLSLDEKYLQALVDENGQLSLNTDAYWKYIDAQLTELELSKVQSILDTVNGMSLEEAQIYANAEAKDAETESTISLIEAMFAQAQLEAQLKDNKQNTTAYTDALNASIPSINSVIGLIEKARNDYSMVVLL